MNVPIISVQIEGMRQQLKVALSEFAMKQDAMFQQAVDSVMQPETVRQLLEESASKYLREEIDSQLKNFFRYGKGREFIEDEITNSLMDTIKQRKDAREKGDA